MRGLTRKLLDRLIYHEMPSLGILDKHQVGNGLSNREQHSIGRARIRFELARSSAALVQIQLKEAQSDKDREPAYKAVGCGLLEKCEVIAIQ